MKIFTLLICTLLFVSCQEKSDDQKLEEILVSEGVWRVRSATYKRGVIAFSQNGEFLYTIFNGVKFEAVISGTWKCVDRELLFYNQIKYLGNDIINDSKSYIKYFDNEKIILKEMDSEGVETMYEKKYWYPSR